MRPFLIALLLLVPALASADEPREELATRVRMMRAYALTEALELDEATAARLFPYLREADEAREPLLQERKTLRKELKSMVEADAFDPKAVDAALARIGALQVDLARLDQQRLQGLDGLLSPEQRVKLVLVRARLEGRVRDLLREERRERRERRQQRRD